MNRITSKNPGTGSPVVIRDATEQDLSRMASDMIRYLPDGLFPHLGNHFVRRWMKTFLTERFGIALVAVSDDEQPIGFLIGSTNQVRHIADVLANQKWGLLLSGLAALSIRPRVLLHFLGTRARPYARRLLGRTPSDLDWVARRRRPGWVFRGGGGGGQDRGGSSSPAASAASASSRVANTAPVACSGGL